MTKITCDIVQDVLPLYYDEVCSQDTKNLVETHLQSCKAC
ncbi:MAG TPA: zf-HC2 domain-containing protein, partial [Solibacillus sp.]